MVKLNYAKNTHIILAMDIPSTTVFETPKHLNWLGGYYQVLRELPEKVLAGKRERISQAIGATTEPMPEVISHEAVSALTKAANQRLRAAIAFCQEVYSTHTPEIFKYNSTIEFILKTNPHFFPELIGLPFTKNSNWDFVMAMDWIFEVKGNSAYPRLLESDTGGVGGVFKLAHIFDEMKAQLPKKQLHTNIVDGSKYLDALLQRFKSTNRSGSSVNIIITEDDVKPLLVDNPSSHLSKILGRHNISPVSSWNISQLSVSMDGKNYLFNGSPVGAIWVRQYSSAIDPTFRGFSRVNKTYSSTTYRRHFISGFWERYLNGLSSSCYVNNPIGCELFTDKAISSQIGSLIRFYLNEEPLIEDPCYLQFRDQNGLREDHIQEVFANQFKWVVKPRNSAGHGSGVVIGAQVTEQSWHRLKASVLKNPVGFVAQQLYHPSTIESLGGLSTRYAEFRILSYSIKGYTYTIPGILARSSSAEMTQRNLTGNATNSIIPILVAADHQTTPIHQDSHEPIECKITIDKILSYILKGYYPNFDRSAQIFKWDRDEQVRYIIRPNPQCVKRAHDMISQIKSRFVVHNNRNFPLVLSALMDREILPDSWVTDDVAAIYRRLHAFGYIWTIEAYQSDKLVGALLGIRINKAFLAETMFKLVDDASKYCVASLITMSAIQKWDLIDLQVEHKPDHPVKRLGEELVDLPQYLNLLERAVGNI